MNVNDVIGEIPLRERVNGEWSVFEAKLFNLITSDGPKENGMYFSGRLRLTEVALQAIRDEFGLMLAERKLLNTSHMGIVPPDPE